MKIVIYTFKVTNRLYYVLDFIFVQYFGLEYIIENNPENIKKYLANPNFFCINYADEKIENIFSIPQNDILWKENIEPQKLFISKIGDMPVLFPDENISTNFPFDIFSAVFYLISRYEEYLPHEQDIHGRYLSHNSILSNPVFSFRPVVEIWLQYFQKELLKRNEFLEFKKHQLTKVFTFDIDNAFQYKNRNWLKHPPNIFKKEVRTVLLNKKHDKYDTFDFIFHFCKQLDTPVFFFFLLNDVGKINSIVNPNSKKLHLIIQKAKEFKIGIHNSYHFSAINLKLEIKKLSKIVNNKIIYSRQHFLKINFPDYFRMIANQKIQIDFSLGYPDVSGCRAGTTQSFYFFDLIKNETSSLLIQPFVFMDATYQYYQKNEDIQQRLKIILEQIKIINGNFVGLFHNDLLREELIFRKLLEIIRHY